MACANCGTDNPGGASFCMGCGSALATACSSCGTELPPNAAFCFSCGAQVGAPSAAAARQGATAEADDGLRRYIPPELLSKLEFAAESGTMQGERRTVTMLFCDVKGSTSAARELDPEEWADIMNGAFEHLIAPVYRYEGTIARLMGDAILAFFGAPIGHEDDPERAVLAALAILDEIEPHKAAIRRDWGIDFDVRVGINTGLVVVGAVGSDLRVEYTAMGDAVNLAARMEQTAAPGTVQITGATRALVDRLFEFEDLGGVEVKGHPDPIEAYRVAGVLERPDSLRGVEGLNSPLIGRSRSPVSPRLGRTLSRSPPAVPVPPRTTARTAAPEADPAPLSSPAGHLRLLLASRGLQPRHPRSPPGRGARWQVQQIPGPSAPCPA